MINQTHTNGPSEHSFPNSVSSAATGLGDAGAKTFEGFSASVKQLARDVESIATEVGSLTADGFQTARDTLSEKLGTLQQSLDQSRTFCVEKSKVAAERTAHYVQERPLQALGIAAAVGAAVAIYMTRSR